jgi:tetratricopeptide (TPR) repeat protein
MAYNNLGLVLEDRRQMDEAIGCYEKSLEIRPHQAVAHNNLGAALARLGRFDEAIAHLHKALDIEPDYHKAHNNLGLAWARQGRRDEAIAEFQNALEIKPDYAEAHNNCGMALAECGRVDEAIAHFQQALNIQPDYVRARYNLDNTRCQQEVIRNTLAGRRELLRSRPKDVALLTEMAWTLATDPNASVRNGAEAVQLAQRALELSDQREPAVLGALAAAYAEAGRFQEALQSAQQALALATSQNNTALADTLRTRIELYQAGTPFRETRQPLPPPSGQR